MDKKFDDLISRLKDPVKRHNNSTAMQGIFSSSALVGNNPKQYEIMNDMDTMGTLNINNQIN